MFKQHLFMSRADRARWRAATDLGGLGELTAQWLEGTIPSHPAVVPNWGPDEETTRTPGLVRVLARANRAGFLTAASQPGQHAASRRGESAAQRAAVEGFARTPDVREALRQAAHRHGLLHVEHAPAAPAQQHGGVVVTTVRGRPFTVFGRPMAPEDIRFAWKGTRPTAVAEVEQAWQITLSHPEFGPTRPLLAALAEAFAAPDTVRCARCYCTEDDPCPGGCSRASNPLTEDLCSACAPYRSLGAATLPDRS
ncbi:DUF6919 domain-containing protein [Kitasatospora sp. NPDC088134]|uniref:DUF6919 domain-containing protein n=1 Tax=Kitasatospora sp. NPDC088134 TaxID=3364071 RepID=UPI0038054729